MSEQLHGNEEPIVSVIIPVYNCIEYLGQAVDSVLLQDVKLEIILVNDSPWMKLEEFVKMYQQKAEKVHMQLRLLVNEENVGVAESRNRGIALAKGKYVALLDDDDIWMPGKLKKQLQVLEKTDGALCFTARELMDADGKLLNRVIHAKRKVTYRSLLKSNVINCSSVIMPKEVAKEFLMGNDHLHEDFILWLNILRKYHFAYGIDEPLIRYRLTYDGKSGNKLKSAKMTYGVYKHMGYGTLRAGWYFCCYALNGVRKYGIKEAWENVLAKIIERRNKSEES